MFRQLVKTLTAKFSNKIPDSRPLGRWNIDYCSKRTNTKIDLANEDHCGPCGQYIISKNVENIKINSEPKFTNKNL
jgi:hypothetical protein